MLYILTENQHNEIKAVMPKYLVFSNLYDDGKYKHDSSIRKLWNFDVDSMLIDLYGKDYNVFLASLESEQYLQIYNYMENIENIDKSIPPKEQSYDILGFHKKEIFNEGDLIEVTYYAERDGDNFSIPIVKETRTYIIENDIYTSREIIINWFYQNGEECPNIKTISKVYSLLKGMQAVERKRKNILASVKMNTIQYIALSGEVGNPPDERAAIELGISVINKYVQEISAFEAGSAEPLINSIRDDNTFSWLDNTITQLNNETIRNLLLNELNYSGVH